MAPNMNIANPSKALIALIAAITILAGCADRVRHDCSTYDKNNPTYNNKKC